MSIKSREEIIETLELCPTSGCAGCPYYGLERCDRALAKDAITLLDRANDKPVYQYALIFTKRDNLSKWFNANCSKFIVDGNLEYSRHFCEAERRYAQERDIKLTLLVRYDDNKCICRIKCPINPLPVRGEFNAVSEHEVRKFLTSLGWTCEQRLPLYFFR